LSLLHTVGKKGYGIIAIMPLQFGLLTGKFDAGVSFAENDHRKKRMTMEVVENANRVLQPVWKLCEKYNCSKTQLALSFILSYQQVSTIIPGIRTAEQAQLNTIGLFKLMPEDIILIESLGQKEFVAVMKLIQEQG